MMHGVNNVKKEVLHTVKEERNILHTIKRREDKWIGHILRGNCLLNTLLKDKWKEGLK
jgi:hypothetical protein